MDEKSVHDMTPGELRGEVQRLRRERQQDAEQNLIDYERVRWTCPECGDEGGPGNCRECMIDGPVFIQRVPGAELIVRELAAYSPSDSSTPSLNGKGGLIERARAYVSK